MSDGQCIALHYGNKYVRVRGGRFIRKVTSRILQKIACNVRVDRALSRIYIRARGAVQRLN